MIDEPLRALFYMLWGTGKTTLAATAAAVPELSPVAFWSIDKSTAVIDRKRFPVAVTNISNLAEWTAAMRAARKDKPKTIVVDTITELHSILLDEVQAINIAQKPRSELMLDRRDYNGAQWGTFKAIRDLIKLDCNLIVTAQDTDIVEGEQPNQRVLWQHAPQTAKSCSLDLPRYFQLVGYGLRNNSKLDLWFNKSGCMGKDTVNAFPAGSLADANMSKIYKAFKSAHDRSDAKDTKKGVIAAAS